MKCDSEDLTYLKETFPSLELKPSHNKGQRVDLLLIRSWRTAFNLFSQRERDSSAIDCFVSLAFASVLLLSPLQIGFSLNGRGAMVGRMVPLYVSDPQVQTIAEIAQFKLKVT